MNGLTSANPGAPAPPRKPRLLLAEDEPTLCILLGEFLHPRYEVEIVTDGLQAWASAQRERPDLLISDIDMPGLDGISLTRRFRGDTGLGNVPVILLTGCNDKEAASQGLQAGADSFLRKPFHLRELLECVDTHLAAPPTHDNATPPAAPPGNPLPRIIVADDHEWIRDILVKVVGQTLPAASVVAVADGLQAFKAYRRGCNFLVTNHAMPHMDGATLIRQIRKQAPGLPILMVSVHASAEVDAMAAGANWFLTKSQIMEKMPALLRQHARVTLSPAVG